MASRGQSLTISYVAWNTMHNRGETEDAAYHTLRWIADGVSAAPTNAPEEVDADNAPGLYRVTLTAAECTCWLGTLAGKSSTAYVSIIPQSVSFEQLPTSAAGTADGLARTQDIPTVVAIAEGMWSAGSRTLTGFGSLVTDIAAAVWTYASRLLTEPQSSQISSAAVAAGSAATAADGARASAETAADAAIAAVSYASAAKSAAEDVDARLPAEPAAKSDVQVTVNAPDITVNPTLTTEQAAQLASAAEGIAAIGTGSGAYQVNLTIKDNSDNLISSARVTLTKGVESYSFTTQADGVASFNVDAGAWAIAVYKSGYTYAGGSVAVSANVSQDVVITANVIPEAPSEDKVNMTIRVVDGEGNRIKDQKVYLQLIKPPSPDGFVYDYKIQVRTSDQNGEVTFTPLKGGKYSYWLLTDKKKSVTIPLNQENTFYPEEI